MRGFPAPRPLNYQHSFQIHRTNKCHFSYPFNIKNTKHQIQDLQEISIDSNLRFASFAINNVHTNIPTKPQQQKMNTKRVDCTTTNEILNLCDTVLKQNYVFPFHWQISDTWPFHGVLTSPVYTQVTEQNHLILSHTGLLQEGARHTFISYNEASTNTNKMLSALTSTQ
jgi:hypothetical protein